MTRERPDETTAIAAPAAGTGAAQELYPRFSAGELARRRAAVQVLMAERGLDVLMIYGNSSLSRHNHADVHYLTGFLGNRNTYVVVPARGEPVVFVQSYNHVPNAREVAAVEARWGGTSSAESVARYAQEAHLGAGTLGYVGEVPVQAMRRWERTLERWRFADVTGAFRRLRLVKSAEELEWLRRGAAFTDAALLNLVENVRPGMREYQLGALVEAAGLLLGGLPHLAYISSTPQDASAACVPRQNLSRRVIAQGDVINTEISVSYWGYSGQLHRPIFVQAPPNDLYRRLWDTALQAYTGCTGVLRAGATVEDVLDAAEVIHARGFTINDGLLHGFAIGLLPPSVRTRRTVHEAHTPFTFAAGMCVVVQPNVVTADERAGVQLGNLLHITATGAECLQRVPVQAFVTK